MTYFEAVILGLVQGLAEFLPVSSSGHLALLQQFFGIDENKVLLFAVMLHVGTLISVFIVYWKDIWELIVELCLTIKDLCTGKGLRLDERPVRKLGVLIIIATIPTGIIGVLGGDFFDSLYTSIVPIGIGLIITGFLLVMAERMGSSSRGLEKMNFRNAFFIGLVQGIAICPGISRSGSTLFGSLICNLDRKFAVKFVFLISIPSILGSAVLELPDAIEAGVTVAEAGPVIVGMLVAAVSGLVAIKTMIKIVSDKKLSYFSYYVWVVGVFVVMLGIFGPMLGIAGM
ncbi:MAG: undecaprenyl-diphosphate phosphatase [Firmicutes bacterium]|nr:undecaprenyl-diphosphate phosphatase [Bacillota bacterium]MDY5855561.1 undecaprenyl-diphosphate phosphatase [Anaerovoracaceae bacterium]